MDDKIFQILMARFDKLENKVDDLVKWRWQVYSMTVVISALLGIGVQIILSYLTK